MSNEVKRAEQSDLEAVAITMAHAFANDPVWCWIYGVEEPLPIETGLGLARKLVAEHVSVDAVHVTVRTSPAESEPAAIALWKDNTIKATDQVIDQRETQSEAFTDKFVAQIPDRIAGLMELGAALHTNRPTEEHWYLGILGTHPDRQSEGLGSALLRHMLHTTDEAGIPTYLESSNPRNYGFYRRHGYEEIGRFSVFDSPELARFWRPVPYPPIT